MEQEPKFPKPKEVLESTGENIIKLRKEVIARVGKRFQISDELINFVHKLQEKYPDYLHRRAYHNLVQSGVDKEYPSDVIEEDFPGEDSVVKFLESFLPNDESK